MEEAKPKRFRGVLANERPVIRRLIAVIFCLLVISMVAAQLMDDIEYVREGIAKVTIITKSWE